MGSVTSDSNLTYSTHMNNFNDHIKAQRFEKDAADGFKTVVGSEAYFNSIKNPYSIVDTKRIRWNSFRLIVVELVVGLSLLAGTKYVLESTPDENESKLAQVTAVDQIEFPQVIFVPKMKTVSMYNPPRVALPRLIPMDSIVNDTFTVDVANPIVELPKQIDTVIPAPQKIIFHYASSDKGRWIYLHDLLMYNYTDTGSFKTTNSLTLSGLPASYESYEKAGNYIQNTIQLPSKADIYLDQLNDAARYFKTGSYKAALKEFRRILKMYPNDVNGLFYSAICNYQLGNINTSRQLLEKTLENSNATFHMDADWQLAECYLIQNKIEHALVHLKKIANSDSFYAEKAILKLKTIKH